jgi:hypothetical protein
MPRYEVSLAVEVGAKSPEEAALKAEAEIESAGREGYRYVYEVRDLDRDDDPDQTVVHVDLDRVEYETLCTMAQRNRGEGG